MIGGFHDVVHIDARVRDADGVGLEDVPRLLMCQLTALDVVGIVGEVDLGAMVYSTADLALLLLPEPLKKRSLFHLTPFRKHSIHGNIPCLSGKKGTFYLPGSTPIADGTFGKIMLFCKLSDGSKVHTLSANIRLNRIQI